MAKIQRLKISTDEKMSMLRGQPGHMPAAPAPELTAPAAEPAPAPNPEATLVASPVAVSAAPEPAQVPASAPIAAAQPATAPLVPAVKRGRGRPPKAEAQAAAAPASGLQPSLIRLEGETQRAALAFIHEELMLHSRRVYLKELVDEAVNYYLQHGPRAKGR
jgi:hypothetical protein